MNIQKCGSLVLVVLIFSLVPQISRAQDFRVPDKQLNFVTLKVVTEDGLTQIQMQAGKGPQTREQAYTVRVPYTENGDTKFREETRTRTVTVVADTKPVIKLLEDVKLRTVSGKAIEANTAMARLKGSHPAILLNEGEQLDPFYVEILKPETIIVVVPK